MLVLWASRHQNRLLMVEEKKVSSCVNYRWVRGSEWERNRNWRQWLARKKYTAVRKAECQNMSTCVFWKKSNKWAGLEPLLMISFTSQNKNETISWIISSIQRKMSQNGRNKVLGLNLSGLSIKPFNSPAEVSTNPCVSSALSLLKMQLKLPLAWISDKNGQQGRRKSTSSTYGYHH